MPFSFSRIATKWGTKVVVDFVVQSLRTGTLLFTVTEEYDLQLEVYAWTAGGEISTATDYFVYILPIKERPCNRS